MVPASHEATRQISADILTRRAADERLIEAIFGDLAPRDKQRDTEAPVVATVAVAPGSL